MDFAPSIEDAIAFSTRVLVVVAVWLFATACCALHGWPQTNEASGSLVRLFWVSSCLGLIGALPALVAVNILRGEMTEVERAIAFLATAFSVYHVAQFVGPPIHLMLPRVTDCQLLDRVQQIAREMAVATPVVRLLPTITSDQHAFAAAGTLQAPQVVVADGIFNRLEPAETDAIVAHELAHFANGSLWIFALIVPISGAVTLVVAAFARWNFSIAFGLAFLVGVRQVTSRIIEFDCDKRAAQAVGFRVMSSALKKVHAMHPLDDSDFLTMLSYATATHPSPDARQAALYDAAPSTDRPETPPNRSSARSQQIVGIVAFATWSVTLFATLFLELNEQVSVLLSTLLCFFPIVPYVQFRMADHKRTSILKLRNGCRSDLPQTIVGSILIAMIGAYLVLTLPEVVNKPDPELAIFSSAFFATLIILIVTAPMFSNADWTPATRKFYAEATAAFQLHQFQRTLDLLSGAPSIVNKSPELQYSLAIAESLCGNRQFAIEAMERLRTHYPRFCLAALALGELLLESGAAERALEVATSIAPKLPRDPSVPLLESRALHRLRRFDEAHAACQRAIALDPNSGYACATAAAIAVDRGEMESAEAWIARAFEVSPNDLYALVVRAEIDLKCQTKERALAAVDKAIRAARANPFAFVRSDIERLQAETANRWGTGASGMSDPCESTVSNND